MDKNYFISQYQKFKELNKGGKPLFRDFLKYCGTYDKKLIEVFGRDAFSKLQEECGDVPNKLTLERTPLSQILEQYGKLVLSCNALPVTADWVHAQLKPSPDGINKVHNVKWAELPFMFIKEYSEKPEWKSAVEILKSKTIIDAGIKTNKTFGEIVQKITEWRPDRKRVIEEGYKIELRSYLEKYFTLEEEVGETNPDLLINKKFPIEIKKDPTQSEYDRLLGQMIRHNKYFGSTIAVVTSVSIEDRYRKFLRLFAEVHDKLGMTAELIIK